MSKIIRAVYISIVLSLLLTIIAPAKNGYAAPDTCTWTGAVNGNWSNAGNWAGCDNGNLPENGDALIFPNVTTSTSTNDSQVSSLSSITFTGTHTINGSSITIASGIAVSSGTATIDNSIVLGSSTVFATTGSGLLDINGSVNLNGNDLAVDPEGGIIRFDGTVSGSGDITHTGSNSVRLTGNNTFTGNVNINGGQIIAESNNALGTTAGSTTVSPAGTLLFDGSGLSIPEDLSISGSGNVGGGSLRNFTGNVTLTGTITMTASTLISSSTPAVLTINGVISGALGSDITILGSVVLNGNNTYAGTTTITSSSSPGSIITFNGIQTSSPVDSNGATISGTGSIGSLDVADGFTETFIYPGTSTTVGTLSTGTLNMSSTGQDINIDISGTTSDQINVTGAVSLNSADLTVDILATPTKNQELIIIANDGVDPISGTFNGLSEGATLSVGGVDFVISYTGGTGNDVTLTAQPKSTSLTLTSNTSAIAPGSTITFTATLGATTPQASGTVEFRDGTTLIGTAPLNGSGIATLTTTALNAVGNRSISAEYVGDTLYDGSVSNVLAVSVTAVAQQNPSSTGAQLANTGTAIITQLIFGFVISLVAVAVSMRKNTQSR